MASLSHTELGPPVIRAVNIIIQGRVVRKPVNANPGLKVNRSINFSCLKMFFTADVLGS